MEIVEHFGIKIALDPQIMSPKMMQTIKEGRYEKAEASRLHQIVQNNEVVLEIGAGIGFISTLLVKNPKVEKVVSYEANSALIEAIKKTVSDNTALEIIKWEIRNAVLSTGDQDPDFLNFYVHKDFWASSLFPDSHAIRVEQVRLHGLNTLMHQLKPRLIVCDIEGGELELFQNSDLRGVQRIYLEIHQKKLGRSGIKALFECFHSRGFAYDQEYSAGAVVLFSRI